MGNQSPLKHNESYPALSAYYIVMLYSICKLRLQARNSAIRKNIFTRITNGWNRKKSLLENRVTKIRQVTTAMAFNA